MHYICTEDFNYTFFKVFDGISVYTVLVMSCDVRLRSRAWLTQGAMTSCAHTGTVSDYYIKYYVRFCSIFIMSSIVWFYFIIKTKSFQIIHCNHPFAVFFKILWGSQFTHWAWDTSISRNICVEQLWENKNCTKSLYTHNIYIYIYGYWAQHHLFILLHHSVLTFRNLVSYI